VSELETILARFFQKSKFVQISFFEQRHQQTNTMSDNENKNDVKPEGDGEKGEPITIRVRDQVRDLWVAAMKMTDGFSCLYFVVTPCIVSSEIFCDICATVDPAKGCILVASPK
jgi:hypothetical protein